VELAKLGSGGLQMGRLEQYDEEEEMLSVSVAARESSALVLLDDRAVS
jgi:hypothetical protein